MAKKKEPEPKGIDDVEESLEDIDEESIPGFGLPREELVRRRDMAAKSHEPIVYVECSHSHDCWCKGRPCYHRGVHEREPLCESESCDNTVKQLCSCVPAKGKS
jgi:hypothetical protein